MVTLREDIGKSIVALMAQLTELSAVRLYMEYAPAEAVTPYVLMLYSGGGFTNEVPSSMFDIYFDVAVVSKDMREAERLANSIRLLLDNKYITLESFDLVAPIRIGNMVIDRSENQNIVFHLIGYRVHVRGS